MSARLMACGVALFGVLASTGAVAQDWPSRPVTMVVPFAPGGPLDVLGRTLQPFLSEALGQQVVVENVPGAGGAIGSQRVSTSKDDHTFLIGSIGSHAIGQSMLAKPPYNAVEDFAHVILVADAPQVLLARADLPANNLKELAAYAKDNQGKMQHGSGGAGTSSHIGCVLVNQTLGFKIPHIPYKGGGPAMQDLLAGRLDYICNYVSTAITAVQSGKAKVISTLSSERVPAFPDVLTAQEEGFKELEISAWNAAFMPKGTNPKIVQTLNAAIGKALDSDGLRQRLEKLGLKAPAADRRSPDYLRKYIAEEIKRWREPVIASGVQHK